MSETARPPDVPILPVQSDVDAEIAAISAGYAGGQRVDRTTTSASASTRELQEFIADHAWGGARTWPRLRRWSMSMTTMAALVARGYQEELAMHVRAARTNALSDEEVS